jgi:ATP-dependent Clp protease adaptor protein ClpS
MEKLKNETKNKEKLCEVPKFAVIFYNNDFTPMEFVVVALNQIFNKNLSEAESVMMEIHKKGSAVVGRYISDVAEFKKDEVKQLEKTLLDQDYLEIEIVEE